MLIALIVVSILLVIAIGLLTLSVYAHSDTIDKLEELRDSLPTIRREENSASPFTPLQYITMRNRVTELERMLTNLDNYLKDDTEITDRKFLIKVYWLCINGKGSREIDKAIKNWKRKGAHERRVN